MRVCVWSEGGSVKIILIHAPTLKLRDVRFFSALEQLHGLEFERLRRQTCTNSKSGKSQFEWVDLLFKEYSKTAYASLWWWCSYHFVSFSLSLSLPTKQPTLTYSIMLSTYQTDEIMQLVLMEKNRTTSWGGSWLAAMRHIFERLSNFSLWEGVLLRSSNRLSDSCRSKLKQPSFCIVESSLQHHQCFRVKCNINNRYRQSKFI